MKLIQKFSIQDQNIQRTCLSKMVADSVNMITFAFDFDGVWEGISKTAVIKTGGETYEALIESDGTIKAENMPVLKAGQASVSVIGGNLYTTGEYRFNVAESGGVHMPDFVPPDLYAQVLERASTALEQSGEALNLANDAQNTAAVNAQMALQSADTAAEKASETEAARISVVEGIDAARQSALDAKAAEASASQAYSDFLNQLGTDVATLVGGKIPASQIPALATTEIYTVESESAMNGLDVQNGDICIRGDEQKSYIYNGGWVRLVSPTDYASRAGHAETAASAENASMINNHRLVELSAGEFATAVKDETTYYLVWG